MHVGVSDFLSHVGGGLLTPQIKSPSDLFSFSHVRNATRMEDARLGALRTVSSSSTGMRATVDEQLHAVKRAQSEDAPDRSAPHPRIGIGLPMSNIYATSVYFLLIARVYRVLMGLRFQLFWRVPGTCQHGWLWSVQ
jgi:hypothetical protein